MRFFRKPESGDQDRPPRESDTASATEPAAKAPSPRRTRSLGETLVDTGVITEEQLQQALAEQRDSGRKLGRVLTDMGLCTQEDIAGALQEQMRRIRIGDLLIDYGYIDESQLEQALKRQKETGRKLGQVLVDMELVDRHQIVEVLADQLQVPRVDLRRYQFDPEVARKLPETLARRLRALPLSEGRDGILVAMADPTDLFAQDEIARQLGQQPQIAVVAEEDLLATLDRVFRHSEAISRVAEELSEELARSDYDLDQLVEAEMKVDAPVVRLLQTLFEDAVQTGASDIHIEPDDRVLRVRQRIDGILHEHEFKERQIAGALVSRLKIMAGLNISERRLPQDGRFNIRVRDRSIDVRVSTLPLQNGESVVMRLLDQSTGVLSLDSLGMPEHVLEPLRRLLRDPHGVILVTGPTGSGKTTTLYSALRELNEPGKKIITVEDPVEYRLPRICQVQVNARIGLDFPRVLRTALRQDPDIVLVGEMRDQETAEIGVRAALTGHLVLSTLHTNDAISTPIRLLDMGVEGYLLAPSVIGVLAQRLARRVCPDCAEPHEPDPRMLAALEPLDDRPQAPAHWRRGTGCNRCNNTGVSGRIGIYELLEIDSDMAAALRANNHQGFADAARVAPGFRPLGQVALDYARQGLIPLDEVLRIAGESARLEEEPAVPEAPGSPAAPSAGAEPGDGSGAEPPEPADPGSDAGSGSDDDPGLVLPDAPLRD
ncbi:GspE/PulE family protein [Thioalkalivibrio sp. ALgr3]|uniref:GspE/PulE family protein n=1 Tax=Thioalkalivibrio sp. ALgr3 TaxID=1239292 RepID=UPI0003674B49|nr:type II/IV secretion system protein [Thioalkalivibrio sp. ALgr3]